MMKMLRPESKTLDDLAEWCAMPKEELHNDIAWFFKRFADFTDYVNHDQYFSRFSNGKYIELYTVAIPVTSFIVMSRQFIWFVALGPHGGESISHEEMIQCFSGWRQVQIATVV